MAENNQAIIDFAKTSTAPSTFKAEGLGHERIFVAHGRDITATDITEKMEAMLPQPRFKTGAYAFGTLDDLVAFTVQHKQQADDGVKQARSAATPNTQTQAFVSLASGSVKVTLDGPGPGKNDQAWGHFTATHTPKFSDQWNAWTKVQGYGTAELAAFLDDHIEDVGLPPVAGKDADAADKRHNDIAKLYGTAFGTRDELMATSRGIRINVKERMAQTINTNSGEIELEYAAEHTGQGGGKLKIPGLFMLNVPVFEGGAVYRLPTRLTYRVKDGGVTWTFKVLQADAAKRTAITDMRDKIKSVAAVPVYFVP